jgi:hypothetical protein
MEFFSFQTDARVFLVSKKHGIFVQRSTTSRGIIIIIIIIIIILSPLRRVFTTVYLQQTMFLGCIVFSCSVFTICATWDVKSHVKYVLYVFVSVDRVA